MPLQNLYTYTYVSNIQNENTLKKKQMKISRRFKKPYTRKEMPERTNHDERSTDTTSVVFVVMAEISFFS